MRPYRSRGNDFEEFWSKFEVLAEVSGWDTDGKKMKRLPLFLEGEAFLVFSKMPGDDWKTRRRLLVDAAIVCTDGERGLSPV